MLGQDSARCHHVLWADQRAGRWPHGPCAPATVQASPGGGGWDSSRGRSPGTPVPNPSLQSRVEKGDAVPCLRNHRLRSWSRSRPQPAGSPLCPSSPRVTGLGLSVAVQSWAAQPRARASARRRSRLSDPAWPCRPGGGDARLRGGSAVCAPGSRERRCPPGAPSPSGLRSSRPLYEAPSWFSVQVGPRKPHPESPPPLLGRSQTVPRPHL